MRDEDLTAPIELTTPHVCEGGNLDCGSGLLLLIRQAMEAVPTGEVLEIRSTEISVHEDLPAWCRLTKNPYLGWRVGAGYNQYFVRRGGEAPSTDKAYEQARNYRWQTRTRWQGGNQTTVFCRNHTWTVGQPASFDVKDEAPSAVEYVLGALGACLAQGFQIRASQRNITIDEMEIALNGQIDNIFVFLGIEQTGHSGFKAIAGTLYVQADADEEVLQDLWQATLASSPVLNTLTRPVEVTVNLKLI